MVKEVERKARPKSVYDNVQYNPQEPPSWQYYRCMSIVIKIFELIFSGLVFYFALVWVQSVRNMKPSVMLDGAYIESVRDAYWPSVLVLLFSLIAICVTVCLFICLLCCVVWMVKRLSSWFCFEFFLHILMIVLWFFASMISIIFAVMHPEYYIICACVFSFFAQLMYSIDCNMQFVYWRESKRRDVYKHSKPLYDDEQQI